MCCVPGKTLLGSVKGPRISPFGTPSWGRESGPSRYCEFGFGPGGMGGGACANAVSAAAAIITGRKDAVRFFMDSPIIYDPCPNPGTDNQFPANCAGNRCQSRVCGDLTAGTGTS